jgi:alkylhydroperoxidase family enzyme
LGARQGASVPESVEAETTDFVVSLLARGAAADLDPADQALAVLATVLAQAPWSIAPEYLHQARAAGLTDLAILQATILAAYFNYLNRVADAVGIDFDYSSPLPRMVKDESKPPFPRPPHAKWPTRPAFGDLSVQLDALPRTADAYKRWRQHVLERSSPLDRRSRSVIARAVALELCDGITAELLAPAAPSGPDEQRLVNYAIKLTVTPWRLDAADLEPLRALGFGDTELFDLISVASFQNTASRLAIGLGPSLMGQ